MSGFDADQFKLEVYRNSVIIIGSQYLKQDSSTGVVVTYSYAEKQFYVSPRGPCAILFRDRWFTSASDTIEYCNQVLADCNQVLADMEQRRLDSM